MAYDKKRVKIGNSKGDQDEDVIGRHRRPRYEQVQDRHEIEDEILELQAEFPGLSDSAIRKILQNG
jgi:hypothetical protein